MVPVSLSLTCLTYQWSAIFWRPFWLGVSNRILHDNSLQPQTTLLLSSLPLSPASPRSPSPTHESNADITIGVVIETIWSFHKNLWKENSYKARMIWAKMMPISGLPKRNVWCLSLKLGSSFCFLQSHLLKILQFTVGHVNSVASH